MVHTEYRRAIVHCRYWWDRFRDLPRWRKRARTAALFKALYWGSAAIKAKRSE